MFMAVVGSIALGSSAYVGLFDRLPQPHDYALFGMVLCGLTVGWLGGRKRPVD
jgi:hypothetical protein